MYKIIPALREKDAKNKAEKILRDAEIRAEQIRKNAQIDGKQTVLEMKQEAEKDIQAQLDKAKNVSGVVNQYLEYDDDGNLQLCAEVYCAIQPSREQCYLVLEIRKFTAPIK